MQFLPTGGDLLVFNVEAWISVITFFVLLIVKIIAFVLSLVYSNESYLAADKRNKATWAAFTGVAVAIQIVPLSGPGMSIIQVALLVAACVFLADVRPALANLRRR